MMHPKFQMMVLANRPGFPFLGNDFFREIGDVFAVPLSNTRMHVMRAGCGMSCDAPLDSNRDGQGEGVGACTPFTRPALPPLW